MDGYAIQIFHKFASFCHLSKATLISKKSGMLSGLYHWKGLFWPFVLLGQTLECCQQVVHGIMKRTGSLFISAHGTNSLKSKMYISLFSEDCEHLIISPAAYIDCARPESQRCSKQCTKAESQHTEV